MYKYPNVYYVKCVSYLGMSFTCMFKQPTTIAHTIDVGMCVYTHIILTQSKPVAIRESGACIVKYTGTVHITQELFLHLTCKQQHNRYTLITCMHITGSLPGQPCNHALFHCQ